MCISWLLWAQRKITSKTVSLSLRYVCIYDEWQQSNSLRDPSTLNKPNTSNLMMSGNMGFMDLRQQYWPWLHLGQYCCLRSIKLHIALITGPYLYNVYIGPAPMTMSTSNLRYQFQSYLYLFILSDEHVAVIMHFYSCSYCTICIPTFFSFFFWLTWKLPVYEKW